MANPPPTDVAVGDVDEDGIPDLIIAAKSSSPVMLGNGDGTFRAPSFVYSGSFAIRTVVLADFNGDDHLDIAGLQSSSLQEGIAVVFLGQGNGTFQPGVSAPIGANPISLAVGDFNSDGISDIVGANDGGLFGDPSLAILQGIGDGTFQPVVEFEVPGPALAVHTADYDGNGQSDIAALVTLGPDEDDPRAIALFFNLTDGTLPEPRFYHTSSSETQAITPGDFNGDGGLDIATANGGQNTVSVILNTVSKSGARVDNAPLDADGTQFNPVLNVEFATTVARFTDTNPFSNIGDFTATIQWGDESTTVGSVVSDGAGGYNILGTHTYSATGDYSLVVTVIDAGDASATAHSVAHVSSADHPINAEGTSFTVAEDTSFSEVVATFTDEDPNGTIHDFAATIHWSDGQSAAGKIVADPVQGFDVVGSHRYALPDVYTVKVEIRSLSDELLSVDSAATVLGVNDPPRFTSMPVTDVIAESPYSYQVTVQDEDDAGADLTIVAMSAPVWLSLIDHGDGTATLSGVPQHADIGNHSVELQVSDGESASAMQSFTIMVANLPHIESQEFVVPENSPSGTVVGTIAISDVDAGNVLSFSIVGGSGATAFAIVEQTGELVVIDPDQLDFETSPTFELVVNVSDADGNSDQAPISVRVRNVNEPPVTAIPEPQTTQEDTAPWCSIASTAMLSPSRMKMWELATSR